MTKLVIGLRKPKASNVILPAGRYPVKVDSVREMDHKSGDGKCVNVSYRIDNDGAKYHGTYVNSYHIIEHSNPKAVDVGFDQLGYIALAVGRNLNEDAETNVDLGSFAGKRLEVRLDAPEEGRTSNPVTGFYSL